VPGVGPKLKAADKEIAGWAKNYNAHMASLKNKTVRVDVAAAGKWSVSGAALGAGIGFHAAGGAIRGPGGPTSDDVPIMASNDEHMWTAEETRKVGGHEKMMKLRAMARKGLLATYAQGGPIGNVSVPSNASMNKTTWAPVNSGMEAMIKKMAALLAKMYPTAGPKSAALLEIAKKYIGVPYVWGGDSPSGFDCSGLIYYIANKFLGIHSIPRVASGQQSWSQRVPRGLLGAGDLSFFGNSAHHVGIHAGGPGSTTMLNAPHTGALVRYGYDGNATNYGRLRPRWKGGSVAPGRSYMVGEDGAEPFTPKSAGTIHRAGSTVININAPLVTVQGHSLHSKQELAREVGSALDHFVDNGGRFKRVATK
jgi:cell wall-associated NlpC family hydrolase